MTFPRKVDDVPYPPELCARCKAEKLLCGRSKCPILEKFYISLEIPLKNEIQGNSPPSVFVGSKDYPKVRIGPAAPPDFGDTSIYEDTSRLIKLNLEEIIKLRYSIYRGYKRLDTKVASSPTAYLSNIHDLVMMSRPTFLEMNYYKINESLNIDPYSQPFGPGGYISSFDYSHGSSNIKIEKVYYDTDMKSRDAVISLFNSGLPLNEIQRIFSLGMTGLSKYRVIVPTRWSITAVDSMISDHLLSNIKNYESIDHIEYFHYKNLGNIYDIILFPWTYSYENIEIWGFGSVWVGNRGISVEEEYEDMKRRVRNPVMGGSFFATKLPILQYLEKIKRNAGIIAIRYVTGDYYVPIGVWQVRENVRNALSTPNIIDNMDQFFGYVKNSTGIDFRIHSKLYKIYKTQKVLGV